MTSKEHLAFALELRKLDTYEVRQHTDVSIQSDAAKRTMAVTELERRRQGRGPHTIKNPIAVPIVILIIVLIAAAAAAYWKFY